jgi:hypothetical protein
MKEVRISQVDALFSTFALKSKLGHEISFTTADRIDLAFVPPVYEERWRYSAQNLDLFRKFNPRAVFPMHAQAGDSMYVEFEKAYKAKIPGLPVFIPQRMGDRFVYNNRAVQKSIWRGRPLPTGAGKTRPPCMPHQRRIHFSGLPLIRQGELRGLIHITENLKCVSDRFWGRLPLGSLSSGSPWQATGHHRRS